MNKLRRRAPKRRKKIGIPYDYEAAYNLELEKIHEWMAEKLYQGKSAIYTLKEIQAGEQFEAEIYPRFDHMAQVPKEGRRICRDNNKGQRNLNDKNARKYVERLVNANFNNHDLWITLTYDEDHLPPDGDLCAAQKNVKRWIDRVNYQRRKRGLGNARYIYITAYHQYGSIRWHHHIIMDGDMDAETVEKCWKQSSRNEIRHLQKDENGLSGVANYIVAEKNRIHGERRWNSSKNLKDPDIKVVHTKEEKPGTGSRKRIGTYVGKMVKDQNQVEEILKNWYPDKVFVHAEIKYNEYNGLFYIHARMHDKPESKEGKKKWNRERTKSGTKGKGDSMRLSSHGSPS